MRGEYWPTLSAELNSTLTSSQPRQSMVPLVFISNFSYPTTGLVRKHGPSGYEDYRSHRLVASR